MSFTEMMRDQSSGVLGMAALYVTHSAYTFAGIISLEERTGNIFFTAQRFLLKKVGIDLGGDGWAIQGRFPSVPGALYHDFGLVGMIVLSVVLAGLVMVAIYSMRLVPGVFSFGVAGLALATLFLSPLLFAPDIIYFSFVAAQFLIIPAIASVVFRLINTSPALQSEG